MSLPQVSQYDVFWCCFPYPNISPFKTHPVLILKSFSNKEGQKFLVVCGGSTLQKDIIIRPSWLVIYITDTFFKNFLGLTNNTKFIFDFNCVRVIPYTEEHFPKRQCKKTNKLIHRCGNLPISSNAHLIERFKKINNNVNINELIDNAIKLGSSK